MAPDLRFEGRGSNLETQGRTLRKRKAARTNFAAG